MKNYRLIFCLIIFSHFWVDGFLYGQSFFEKIDKYNLKISLPVEQNQNDFNAFEDKFMRYDATFRPTSCNCEIRYIINKNYKPGPFLPPHAEMIRLLATLGSNGTNSILVEQYPDDSDEWAARAFFGPKMEITTFDFGALSTYYKDDDPLIHVIVFYNGDKKEIEKYLEVK